MHQAAQTVAKTPVPKEEKGMGPNSLPPVALQQALQHKLARESPSQSSPHTASVPTSAFQDLARLS